MIESIFENLFPPASNDDLFARYHSRFLLLDKFVDELRLVYDPKNQTDWSPAEQDVFERYRTLDRGMQVVGISIVEEENGVVDSIERTGASIWMDILNVYKKWKKKQTNENLFSPLSDDERFDRDKAHFEQLDAFIDEIAPVFDAHISGWSKEEERVIAKYESTDLLASVLAAAAAYVLADVDTLAYADDSGLLDRYVTWRSQVNENLFKPHDPKEVERRQEGLFELIDDFVDDVEQARGLLSSRERDVYLCNILSDYYYEEDIDWEGVQEWMLSGSAYVHPETVELMQRYDKWKSKQGASEVKPFGGFLKEQKVSFDTLFEAYLNPTLKEGKDGLEDRIGRCYELSGRYASQHPEVTLVHGTITNNLGDKKTIAHAWVEKGDDVFDPVLDEWYEKRFYEAIYGGAAKKTYTHEEVLVTMLRYEHWGPWDADNPPKRNKRKRTKS